MQWFRAAMAAGLMTVGLGMASALADGAEKPSDDGGLKDGGLKDGGLKDGGLKQAAYDVILVPRQGRGAPRVLTERGWRTFETRPARSRGAWSQRLAYPYQPREAQSWRTPAPYPDPYRNFAPSRPAPRWTSYDGYRSGWARQRPY